MISLFVCLLLSCLLLVNASTFTVYIGREDRLPVLNVKRGDLIRFVNVDHDAAHHISADDLPGFQSGWLYPKSFPQAKGRLPTEYEYYVKQSTPYGGFTYTCDAHASNGMEAKIYVLVEEKVKGAPVLNYPPKTEEVPTLEEGEKWDGDVNEN